MSYDIPTVDDVIARVPELADTSSDVFELVLLEAQRRVDTTWLEGDYTTALIYLTAHLASIANQTVESGGDTSSQLITSESLGRISLSYGTGGAAAAVSPSGLQATSYGLLFLGLVKRNFPAVLVV
jgi:hypothetical protein